MRNNTGLMTKCLSSLATVFLLILLVLPACRQQQQQAPAVDIAGLPPISGERINVVVEIPAGTNHKIEYDPATDMFRNDTLTGGLDRVIDFLPYPGNYGFIPGTLLDQSAGGDGDALDVLVLAEARPTGTVLAAIPIGAMLLRDNGEVDTKIIAVPAEPGDRILTATNFVDFMLYYDAARRILEDWFLHYKGRDAMQLIRWEDERFAWQEIRRWSVQQ
jgi:inorganic pyrophosphatase